LRFIYFSLSCTTLHTSKKSNSDGLFVIGLFPGTRPGKHQGSTVAPGVCLRAARPLSGAATDRHNRIRDAIRDSVNDGPIDGPGRSCSI
jgi:hypothetical protein